MKIELNEHAAGVCYALFWATAAAVIFSGFASCAARCTEAEKRVSVKVEGNTIVNAK